MKIVIVSDSHGRDILNDIMFWENDADLFIHCGDMEDDPEEFPFWVSVRGNCDYFDTKRMPDSQVLEVAGHRIYIEHGHKLPKHAMERFLALHAKENHCDIALYGHTHEARNVTKHGIRIINPGSAWKTCNGDPASYAVLNLTPGHMWAQIKYEPDWPREEEEEDA